jgi:hypothetical protein
MSLGAFVTNLSVLVRKALNENQSTTQSAVCEEAPFAADYPELIIRCMRNDAYYNIVVSKHGKIAGIQTVQLVLPPPISTDGLTSAYEIALTDAINKTHSERIVGKDLHVQMDNIGAGVASTHIANIIIQTQKSPI